MFRHGKIIEKNKGSSRSHWFAEMSKQQQLIESKKQEIKARLEERKRKEVVDSLQKSESKVISGSKVFKSSNASRLQCWKRMNENAKSKYSSSHSSNDRLKEEHNANSSFNTFSNDGSFLQQFQQITKCENDTNQNFNISSYDIQMAESKCRDDEGIHHTPGSGNTLSLCSSYREGIPYPPPNVVLPASTSLPSNVQQPQSLYSMSPHPPPTVASTVTPNIHNSLTPVAAAASVPVLSEVSSPGTAALQTVSLIQVPVSVPASSVILSCPLQTTLVSSESVVHLPLVHTTLSHSSTITVPIQTVPLQTTVIPAQIQITSPATISPQSTLQTIQINPSSANVLLQPQSILVPSECIQPPPPAPSLPNTNVPPPPIPPQTQPPSCLPQLYSPQTSLFEPSGGPPQLPPVHIPPPNYISPNNRCQDDMRPRERTLPTSELLDSPQKTMMAENRCGNEDGGTFRSSRNRPDLGQECGSAGADYQSYSSEKMTKYIPESLSSSSIDMYANLSERNEDNKDIKESTISCSRKFSQAVNDGDESDSHESEDRQKRKRKRKSRWAPEESKVDLVPAPVILATPPETMTKLPGICGPIISQVKKTDPALLQYAMKQFGTTDLSDEDWKKAEDAYKVNLLYQDMLKKRQQIEKLKAAGKFKYEYDSDEETEGGTWEHKLRNQEMLATQLWADELTEQAKGKHHIGDFLPPEELDRFLEKYDAVKQGREPDLSDYKEFKLKEDNIGFQMLQKLGWTEGQGLGADGSGIKNPVSKNPGFTMSHGLGNDKPDELSQNDDEYDAYRKRMMLAYRFRPNPLNNPRRPYY